MRHFSIGILLLFCFSLFIFSGESSSNSRIVGGKPASMKKWPFQVAIVERSTPDARKGHNCSGGLVRPRIVLTAAHCVAGWRSRHIDVVFRRSNLGRKNKGRRIAVQKMRIHPKFNGDYPYDLGLLQLKKPLPGPYLSLRGTVPEGTFEVAGWGWTGVRYSKRLLSVSVERLMDNQCSSIYGASFDSDNMFCAGGKGRDTCTKDSGGPLIQRKDGKVLVFGVVSWGGANCKRHPTVYAKLDVSWIRKAIQQMKTSNKRK
jgi:secreted trypsin-like serine protease